MKMERPLILNTTGACHEIKGAMGAHPGHEEGAGPGSLGAQKHLPLKDSQSPQSTEAKLWHGPQSCYLEFL